MGEDQEVAFAIKVYEDTRGEIRDRVKMREQLIYSYITGTVAFIGVSIGLDKTELVTRILLCSVMPVISLIVAINVSRQIRTIERLANFLREDFNNFMIEKGAWAPHWDWKNRWSSSTDKDRSLLLKDTLTLHLPSIISIVTGFYFISRKYDFSLPNLKNFWSFFPASLLILLVASCVFAMSLGVTLTSLKTRRQPNRVGRISTPKRYVQKGILGPRTTPTAEEPTDLPKYDHDYPDGGDR